MDSGPFQTSKEDILQAQGLCRNLLLRLKCPVTLLFEHHTLPQRSIYTTAPNTPPSSHQIFVGKRDQLRNISYSTPLTQKVNTYLNTLQLRRHSRVE